MMKINNRWKFIASLVISLFLLSFSCANLILFRVHVNGEVKYKIFYFVLCIIFSASIFFLGGFKYNMSKRTERIVSIVSYVIAVLGSMNISILFADGFVGSVYLYFINVLFYVFFGAIALAITGKLTTAAAVTLGVSYLYNVISFIVYSFRGTSLMPTDFMAIGTAMNVASQYKFKLKYQMVTATIATIVHFMLIYKFPVKQNPKNKKIKMRICGLLSAVVAFVAVTTVNYDRYDVSVFDQRDANFKHGSAVGFYVNATKMGLKKVEGYSPENVDNKLLEYGADERNNKKRPNIIVIMNESYADLRAVGDFEVNKEYMSFFKSLKKNTIKGELLVSPFGGYTCNSEYEFLTGMNTGLLSAQSIPYMHMINSKMPYSLNTHLKQLGYETIAMHPYYKNGWNRTAVYNYMGFDEFMGINDYTEKETIRNYVSDYANYREVLKTLYNKEKDERKFIFNITMQNHGGYEYEDFESDVKIEGLNGNYPQTEQFLSCLKFSDEALEALLTELKKFDEPVVVAMFGDHQPAVEEEFFEELYGADLDDLSDEELSRRYITPFMIWANYDIEEQDGVKTSPCYLSNLIMDVAKLPKSRVQLYLDDLKEQVPQLNPLGYYDKDGVWHKHEDCDELKRYYDIQYSLLNGENLNYDFVLYDRKYDTIGEYILSPKYIFSDEANAIKSKQND